MSPDETGMIADYLKALAHPLRLSLIVELQDGPLPVTALVEKTGAKQCYVSQQLMKLTRSGILNREQRPKRFVYYSLKDRGLLNMLEMVRIGMQNPDDGGLEPAGTEAALSLR